MKQHATVRFLYGFANVFIRLIKEINTFKRMCVVLILSGIAITGHLVITNEVEIIELILKC